MRRLRQFGDSDIAGFGEPCLRGLVHMRGEPGHTMEQRVEVLRIEYK